MSDVRRDDENARVLVDLTLCLLGSAIVLLGWHSTYAGSGWWIAGLAASLLAAMVAVVVRDVGGGGEIVGLLLVVGYVIVAGPLARDSLAFGGLDTVTDGLAGTGEVWRVLFTTHPPVDSTGPALLPPILTGLVSAGFGTSLALGSRRPAAPLLPFAASLTVVLLAGQHETASLLGLGAGTGVLVLVWLRVRALRLEEEQVGRDPSRGRRALVTALVLAGCAATAFFVVDDDSDPGRFVLRDEVRPYAVSGLRTPLDEFRDLVLSDRRLLVVDGLPAGYRLRFAALDRYDGQTWEADNDTDPARTDDRFLHVSSTIDNPADGPERTVTIQATKDWGRPWVPTIGAVESFVFADSDPDTNQRSQLLYNPATQTALLPGGLGRSVGYSFTTRETDQLADRQMQESKLFDSDLYDRLQMLDPVITYWITGSYTPMDAMFKVAAGLRKIGRYSHGVEPWEQDFTAGHDLERITDNFLLTVPTVGDEEQYAAAMALLANRMRIPARVVVGAIVPPNGVVRGADVTAWVEVRADDGTWRTVPTDVFMSRQPPDRLDAAYPAGRDYEPRTEERPDRPDSDPKRADDQSDDDASREAGHRHLWWLLLVLLVPLAAAFAPVMKWRRRRRRQRSRRVSARYVGAWDELIDHARDLGFDVPVGAARPIQAAVLERGAPLALEADRLIYSDEELDHLEAAAFWQAVDAESQALDAGATRVRRLRAPFSLRSLRRKAAPRSRPPSGRPSRSTDKPDRSERIHEKE